MRLELASLLAGTGAAVFGPSATGEFLPVQLTVADLRQPIRSVCIDSRQANLDALFVALPGETTDGHTHVGDAFQAGAVAALVSRVPMNLHRPPGLPPAYLLVTSDPLTALQHLATYWRERMSAEIMGITGSVGKTTTKEIVASVLAARLSVLRSEANLNTEIGLPLTLLRLQPDHQVAVLEMGMHHVGDIAQLAEIARPQIGTVTTIAPIHLERMGSIEAIAREKSRLIAALPHDGLAVCNADDPWTRAMARSSGIARTVTIGTTCPADFRAEEIVAQGLDGVRFTLLAEGQYIPLRTGVPGAHTVPAFLTAAVIARHRGMTWDEIVDATAQVRLEVRQRVLRPLPGVLVVDDRYNASPPSMRAALDVLRSCDGERVAVLGDMLELGPQEEHLHRQIGDYVAKSTDWLIARGQRAGWMADEAVRSGLSPARVLVVQDNAAALAALRSILAEATNLIATSRTMHGPRDRNQQPCRTQWSVLIKGSRGMRMEEIVQGLEHEA